mmetsp:Transcript_28281/g.49077  ORF Transcript_28281/g.49077 Transcript_28281/m.49077 type:complete len:194 (-) Transcript_28281:151-732(-)
MNCERIAMAMKATHDRRPLVIPAARWLHDAELHATPGLGETGTCSRAPIVLDVVEVDGGDSSGSGNGGNKQVASLVLRACGVEATDAAAALNNAVGTFTVSAVRYNPKVVAFGSESQDMERVTGLVIHTLIVTSDTPSGLTKAMDWLLTPEAAAEVAGESFTSRSAQYTEPPSPSGESSTAKMAAAAAAIEPT